MSLPQPSSVAALFKLLGSIETNPFGSDSDMRMYDAALVALKAMQVLDREALLSEDVGDFIENSGAKGELNLGPAHRTVSHPLILAAWYRLFPLEDDRLLRWIDLFFSINRSTRRYAFKRHEFPVVTRLLSKMGKSGEQLLTERAERRARALSQLDAFAVQ